MLIATPARVLGVLAVASRRRFDSASAEVRLGRPDDRLALVLVLDVS
jgi:hypothetical protein